MAVRPAHAYPFSAIVGQKALRTALILNAVDPRVGGVLIRGDRGTAKSTSARALASLLPPIEVLDGCPYACDPGDPAAWCPVCAERAPDEPVTRGYRPPPFAELPLSATEDRLVGSLDLQRILAEGERAFQPGVLASAHRGVLFVDEVNLLEDHLVDMLLDVAAAGVNTVERDGLSVSHPSRFVLVGTMNPDEGEVRPQLLDRFGLCVDVSTSNDIAERVEIVRRCRSFDADPAAFCAAWAEEEDALRADIARARGTVGSVCLADSELELIASVVAQIGAEGHRGDQVLSRAAAAHAALEASDHVRLEDILATAPLVLAHRSSRRERDSARAQSAAGLSESIAAAAQHASEHLDRSRGEEGPDDAVATSFAEGGRVLPSAESSAPPTPPPIETPILDRLRAGKRREKVLDAGRGRFSRASDAPPRCASELAVEATVRSAAVRESLKPSSEARSGISIDSTDLRRQVKIAPATATIVFAVDASGSMGAMGRMEAAKAAVIDLLTSAYERRDRVGLVSFRGDRAETLLAPTSSVQLARLRLRNVPTGGSTPLAAGILTALDLLESDRRRDDSTVPWLVLVTDGRANVGLDGGVGSEDARAAAARVRKSNVHTIVLDTAAGGSGAARELADLAGARYQLLTDTDLGALVRRRVGARR